jgi:hypothetical protein
MDQNFETEIAECLEEVRVFLQRQRERHEEFMCAEKGSPEPRW